MRAINVPLAILIAAHLQTAVLAQRTAVVPQSYDRLFGYNLFEWSCPPEVAGRVQNIFFVDPGAAGTATGIAFRRDSDNNSAGDSTYPPITVDLELGMGHAARQPPQPSWRYDENRAPDYRTVVRRQVFSFPAVPLQNPTPYPFTYRIPFDVPFDLTAGRWALWEMTVHSANPPCRWQNDLDAAGWSLNPLGVTPIGQPCGNLGLGENSLATGSMWAGAGTAAAMNPEIIMRSDHIALLFLGLRDDQWLGHPLPLDLTPFGAPGCSVYVSLDFVWPLRLHGEWTYFLVDLPNDNRLVGADLFFQGVRFLSVSNPLGVVTSQGYRVRVGPRPFSGGSVLVGPWLWGGDGEYAQRGISLSMVFELTLQ